MKSINATEARKKFFELTKDIISSHEPLEIRTKHGTIIMISQEDWEDIQETLYLESVPGLSDSIIKGMKTPEDACVNTLSW